MIVRVRIMIERSLGGTYLGPGLETSQVGERREVVSLARLDHLLRRLRCRKMAQQALGRRLVLAECPNAPEEGQEGPEAPLRPRCHAVMPALFGDLRRIADGNRPGARRVHDESALASDKPLVVGGVVPRRGICGIESCQLGAVLERLAHLVRFYGDFLVLVDQDGAE